MATERHEAVLTANITDLKRKLNEASRLSGVVGDKIKKDLSTDMSLFDQSSWNREIIETDNNIRNLSVNMGKLSQNMSLTRTSVGGVSKELNNMSTSSKKVEINTQGISKAFDKGLKSVKRMTLGFLGARSAFMLFRKYLGEYQSQNEDFANKMQLTTNVLVNSLAPAFEFFGNVVQYAVIGLARIIELLTGVNILAKTVDNGFKGASKSAKEFNDNLSGLDEISNIDQSASGLSTGLQSQLNALDEFQKKIAEVDAWLKKTGLDKFFVNLGDVFKNIWSWVSQHPWETLLGIGTFLSLKDFILPALLGGNGIAGLTGAFEVLGVAIAGAITIGLWVNLIDKIKEAIDAVNDYHKVLEGGIKQTDKDIAKYQELIAGYQEKIANGTMTPKGWEQYQITLKFAMEMIDYQNTLLKEQASPWEKVFGYSKKTKKELQANNELIENYMQVLNTIPTEKKITLNLELDSYKAEQKIKQLFDPMTKLKSSIGKADGGIFTGSSWQPITAYASGGGPTTGEMFVAREAGPEMVGTIGGHTAVMNNDQIVASVSAGVYEAVLSAMGGQGDRPIVLNVNGKELAKVTYGDFQEESSRRGTNTSIRRV